MVTVCVCVCVSVCVCVCVSVCVCVCSRAQSLSHVGLFKTIQPARLLCPCDFPGKNTGVGYHALLQRTLLTQGLKLGPLHCRQIRDHLSHNKRKR